jgi:DNA-binding NarL/FixJ family response regulator
VDVPLRCLLVDDSPHFLEAASKFLEGEGVAVVGVASTSADALARVRELEPDVTIVDIGLGRERLRAGPAARRDLRRGDEHRPDVNA